MKSNKQAIIGLSMGHFVADLYASAIVPLYPLITQKLGITLASISLIISMGHLVSSMLQPLFGFFADKMKKRAFMIKTFCYNNPNVSKFMGLFMGLGTIGYSLGPVISSNLVDKFGQNGLSYITFIGILTAIILYFEVPKIPTEAISKSKEGFASVMKEILKNKVCMKLVWIAIVKSGVSISFGTYIPFILKDFGFSLNKVGLIVTLFFALSGLSMIVSSKLEEKIGAVNIIRLSFFTILPLVILFHYLMKINPTLGVTTFIISGFFIFLSVSVTIVAAQKIMSNHTGVISGVMQGFSWGIGALSLAPLGFIGEKFGIIWILIIMATLALLTGLFGLDKATKEALADKY